MIYCVSACEWKDPAVCPNGWTLYLLRVNEKEKKKNAARAKMWTCVSCTSPTVNLKRRAKAIFVQKEDDQKCDFSNLPSVCLQDCHSQLLLISCQIWSEILNWIIYSACEHNTSAVQRLAKTQVILQHFSQRHDAASRRDRRAAKFVH